jgi:hypothetical protein
VMFGLAVGSCLDKSPTFDEGFYIARGWAFLRTGRLLPLGHPPFTNLLNGLGVLLEPGLPDPSTLDGWDENEAESFSEDLLWNRGVNADRIVFLARLPVVWLGLLLGAVVWRWAREDYGRWGAALALALYAFSPNVLAHTRLATTDLGVGAFYVMALYAWTRFLHRRTARWLITGGVMFGLAQASKYSALLLIPTLGVMTLWYAWRRGPLVLKGTGWPNRVFARLAARSPGWLWTALASLFLMGLVGLVALWASYLFMPRPYPLGAYVAEFRHFLGLAAEGHRAYLMERFSQSGWWYYHPFTLAAKMPLPTLLLLALALALAVVRGVRPREWEIAFPALAYLGASMFGSLNVGLRYLLPTLPLIFVFTARLASGSFRPARLRLAVAGVLLTGVVAANLSIYPHYLAFFNLAFGGPDNGYRLLIDSNLDWGQDLPGLADYLQERGADRVYLSYFGQADPAYYGIDAVSLPAWPPPPPDPDRPDFHPVNPAPGLYAISASNLVGVQLYEPDSFGYFRAGEPVARIGHSIFIYEVPAPEASPTWFAQCAVPEALGGWSVPPSESEDAVARLAGLSGLEHVYFNCQQSLFFRREPGWLLLPAGIEPLADPGDPDYLARHDDGTPRYTVWLADRSPEPPHSTVESPSAPLPLSIAGHLDLLGYEVSAGEVAPGDVLTLTVWWRVDEPPPPPVSIFAHLLAADGSLFQAGDALGVPAEDWRPGMVLAQAHHFTIGEDAAPGDYALAVGLYRLDTGQRYPVASLGGEGVDRIVLRSVRVAARVAAPGR